MKIGLALSGGGIRGIAHAGVLKALEDSNIPIDIIGGCSSGSLIASLYAMGYSPYYIYILFKRYSSEIASINSMPIVSGISNFMMNKKNSIKGLKEGDNLASLYNRVALKKGVRYLKDISMPLVIPTVDAADSKEYIFTNHIPENCKNPEQYITDVSLGTAVRSSSSFPAVFSPCEYKEHLFMDGGVLDNIPVSEVKKQGADKIIAVKFTSDKIDKNSNLMDFVMKSIDIMGSKISEEALEMSDYILTVYTDKTGLLDIEKLDMCYKYGYTAVMKNLPSIKKTLFS